MAMVAFGTNFLANVASDTVKSLLKKMRELKLNRDNHRQFFDMLNVLHSHLIAIRNTSSEHHTQLSPHIERCINDLFEILESAKSHYPEAPLSLFDPRNIIVHNAIQDVKTKLELGFGQLDSLVARENIFNQMTLLQPPVPLLQPEPETGFVGDVIKTLEAKLLKLLGRDNPARIIVVYGMGGVGKTTLLYKVYNSVNQENVAFKFSYKSWLTISQQYDVFKLQRILAKDVGMQVNEDHEESNKMRLKKHLREKRILVILDDVWSEDFDILKLGLAFRDKNNGDKIVITSRNRDIAKKMGLPLFTEHVEVQTLDEDDAWKLFRLCSFGSLDMNSLSRDNLKIAEKVCKECKGLPLAIKVIAVSFPKDGTLSEQLFFLKQLKMVDPVFVGSHQEELFHKLKLSYDSLPSAALKDCFLYTACMFAEDEKICPHKLIRMWISEGFVEDMDSQYDYNLLILRGMYYLKILFYRCLISIEGIDFCSNHVFLVPDEYGKTFQHLEYLGCIKVHDCIRDMAIMLGRDSTHGYRCFGGEEMNVKSFPTKIENVKRLSLHQSSIGELPSEFVNSEIMSLNLSKCTRISYVPDGFFNHLFSLKILDLSHTNIGNLPSSIGILSNLLFLDLSHCGNLAALPNALCSLSQLQILDVRQTILKSLPSSVGDLKDLKELRIDKLLEFQPKSLCCLTSLNVLEIQYSSENSIPHQDMLDFKDLTGFTELQELSLHLCYSEFFERECTDFRCWSQMKYLSLQLGNTSEMPKELPKIVGNMRELERMVLDGSDGVVILMDDEYISPVMEELTIRNCIGLQELACLDNLAYLKRLVIFHSDSLKNLNIGKHMQELTLSHCFSLEHLVWPNDFSLLKRLKVSNCPRLNTLGIGKETGLKSLEKLELEKLCSLEELGEEQDQWNQDRFPKLHTFDISNIHTYSGYSMQRLENLRRKLLL